MKFSRVFLGYNPQDVESHITQQKKKQDLLLAEQKQRIDELADENYSLQKELEQLKAERQAVVQCLVQAQQCAENVKKQADRYAQVSALKAKTFFDAWQTFAQTFVSTLTDEEVRRFNSLKKNAEEVLKNYLKEVFPNESEQFYATFMGGDNPLEKLKNAQSGAKQQVKQVIDLDELTNPTESLEEICKALGLNVN